MASPALRLPRLLRVVFDTNILISALLWHGPPSQCVELARLGLVRSVTCNELLDEFVEVLLRRFRLTIYQAEQARRSVVSFSEVVAITGQLKVVVDDPDDDKVIECAVVGKADYIVTGDHHLLALGQYGNISIVKAAQFISILSAP
ncbi:MAG: putative toxin-antitoxin system toxin component, PIN family [Armatimonadota bacterium]|nr:putative toxin-antitoxin system toxin component, PIN family [Armatimonadota bacterium]